MEVESLRRKGLRHDDVPENRRSLNLSIYFSLYLLLRARAEARYAKLY